MDERIDDACAGHLDRDGPGDAAVARRREVEVAETIAKRP